MKKLIAISGLLVLAACVDSISLAPAGPYQPDAGFQTSLQDDWTHYPKSINPMTTQGSVLTKDGLRLNQIHMLTLESETPMLKATKNDNFPEFRAGMSEIELIEFLTSSLSILGFQDVEATNVEEESIGGLDGVRVKLAGKQPSGLNIKGDVAMVRHDGMLSMVMYIAPTEYYFDYLSQEFSDIISAINFS